MIEVDIATLKIGNCEDSSHCDVSHVVLALADNLRAERGCGALAEEFIIVLLNVDLLLDSIDSLGGNFACTLETISNLQGVNALIKQLLCLVEKRTSENDNTCSSITDLVVLGL